MLALKAYIGDSKIFQHTGYLQSGTSGFKSDALLCKLTWQVLVEECLTQLFFVQKLHFWTYMAQIKSIEDDQVRILIISVLQIIPDRTEELRQESIRLEYKRSPVISSLEGS